MKKRWIAGLLFVAFAAALLPLPSLAAGGEPELVRLMCYSDRAAENYYPFLVSGNQLYIRSDIAADFSGFTWDGQRYTRDGVQVSPAGISYRNNLWFPIEDLMRQMETAVVEDGGALYFCSASMLKAEFLTFYDQMDRLPTPFDDENLAFQSGLVISAAYNILSGARFSTLWRGYYEPLLEEALYEIAVPQNVDDPIFAWLQQAKTEVLDPSAKQMEQVDSMAEKLGLPQSSVYYSDDDLERLLRMGQEYKKQTGSLGFSLSDFYQGVARASFAYGLESSYLRGISSLSGMNAEDGREEALQAAAQRMMEVYQDRVGWDQLQNLVDTFVTEQLEKKAALAVFACLPKALKVVEAGIKASDFPKQASAIEKSAAFAVIQNMAYRRARALRQADEIDYVELKYAMLLYYKAAMLGYEQYTFDEAVGAMCASQAQLAQENIEKLAAVLDRDLENYDYSNPSIDVSRLSAYSPTAPVSTEDLSGVTEQEQPNQVETGQATLEAFVRDELAGQWLDHGLMPDSVPAHPEWTAYEKGYVETGEGIIGAWRLDLNEDACDELVVLRQAMGSFPTLRLQVYGFQNGSYSQIYLLYEEELMAAGSNGCYLAIQPGPNAHVAYCLYGTMYAVDWKQDASAVTRIEFPERAGSSISQERQSSTAQYRAYYGDEAIGTPAAYVDASNGQLALYLTQASRQIMVGGQ